MQTAGYVKSVAQRLRLEDEMEMYQIHTHTRRVQVSDNIGYNIIYSIVIGMAHAVTVTDKWHADSIIIIA